MNTKRISILRRNIYRIFNDVKIMIADKRYPLFLRPMQTGKIQSFIYISISALLIVAGIGACRNKADEPSYLLIRPFTYSTNNITQGTALQTITEAFLFIDEKPAGVYHLPATVPLALKGTHAVKIAPAVVENAIASNPRYAYTFLTPYDTTFDFRAGETEINPRLKYRTTTKFELIEDFENPVLLFTKTSYNNDTLYRDSDDIAGLEPGGHFGVSHLQNGNTLEYATKNQYDLPSSTLSNTFLEMHYRTEIPLVIGIYSIEPQFINKIPVLVLNPKDTWTKVYINLTTDVSGKPAGTVFKIFIGTQNTSGSVKNIYIDNIKLIHFE
jgi:hypothetical protein